MTGIDTDNQNAPRLLPVPEAAQALGVSERTVWRRIRSGKLPTTDIGGKTCVQLTAATPGTDTDKTAVSMTGKAPDTAAPLLIEVLQGTISQLRTDNERLWRKLDEQAQQISDLTKIMLPPPPVQDQTAQPAMPLWMAAAIVALIAVIGGIIWWMK